MSKYDIKKHTRRLFPWFWQNATNMALVDLIAGVFNHINDTLSDIEVDARQRAGYSIQRLSLESSLNDRFDNVLRRISVVNSISSGFGFVFNEYETITSNLEIFIFNEDESLLIGSDESYVFNETESQGSALTPFSVVCPIAIESSERLIRAWIEAVQITGTSYELIFI